MTLVTYPNSGEEWVTDSSEVWTDVDSQWKGKKYNIVDFIDEWRELGFKWIGGCCRKRWIFTCSIEKSNLK